MKNIENKMLTFIQFINKNTSTVLLITALTSSLNAAETKDTANEIPDSCSAQAKELCSTEISTLNDRLKCLIKNISKLDETCRHEMTRFARLFQQAEEQSGGSLISPAAMASQAPPFPMAIIDNNYIPGDNSMRDTRIKLSAPVIQGKEDYLALAISAGQIRFDQELLLSSGRIAPEKLDRVEIGIQYTQKLSNYRTLGLRGSIGQAGDYVLQDSKDATYSLIGNFGFPTATGGYWLFNIFASNNSPLGDNIPVPGVSYIYRSANFTGVFGFPVLSLQWTPAKDETSYSISLLGLSFTAEAATGDIKKLQKYINFKWSNQSFTLRARKQDKDRLTLEEKKIGIGLRTFTFDQMIVEAEAGYAFDRLVYSGNGLRNFNDGSADMQSNAYLSLNLKAGF